MTLPGGAADKAGNRYETQWTVWCMTRVMAEEASSIRLEPPGFAGEGVEFVLNRAGILEGHQVKRQHSGLGHWSLTALEQDRVLSNFWNKLRDPTYHCVFVSAHAADELSTMAERARDAKNFSEFETEFVKGKYFAHLDKICGYWQNCSREEAFYALKRVHVEGSTEGTLRENVRYRLETLVDASSSAVFAALAQFGSEQLHQELHAHNIWRYLEEQNLPRRSLSNDPYTLTAVAAANAKYLDPLRRDAIADVVIPRQEVTTALDILMRSNGKRDVLFSGEAGIGKSGVGLQVVEAVRCLGWPVLAFRIDRLETMLSPKDVGRQLDLRDSPVNVLANIAQQQDCLLLIDQIDAVSRVSGRNPHFFDCVGELIKQARIHPKMRLILLCRKFDIDNDDRLRRLSGSQGDATEVPIGKLSEDIIRQTVKNFGLDVARLTLKQVEILSIPLHLKLLSEITSDNSADPLAFATVRDLFARYWEAKQDVLRERLGRIVQWPKVIDALCDFMSDRQVLSAPRDVVADCRQDALDMASEHVLVHDGQRYAFFHETFFDYAFARRFVAHGNSLQSLLLDNEQFLFRRAQVRQILLHEREENWPQYLADLAFLVFNPDVRFHIKQIVFALLAQLPSPTQDEWTILSGCLNAMDEAIVREARLVLNTVPWFRLIRSVHILQKWLESSDEGILNPAIHHLSMIGRVQPDEVAEIIEPYFGKSQEWDNRIASLLSWSSMEKSRRSLDLFLRLLHSGSLDRAAFPFASQGFLSLYDLPEKQPEWSCEVLGCYFERRLQLCLERGLNNPFDADYNNILQHSTDNALRQSANRAPDAFVKRILPFMLCVLELTAVREGEPPWGDSIWPFRMYGPSYSLKEELLNAMEDALRLLAANDPDKYLHYAEQLRRVDYKISQFLLIRSYEANGIRFADEAVDYLCEHPGRLHTGYVDSGYWATRQLLDAITPHCSDGRLHHLETFILNYYSWWERSAQSYHKGYGTARGEAQLTLLNGIDSARRSDTATRRLEEWRRKFRRLDNRPAQGIIIGCVASPIIGNAAEKMTDKQWLNAIAKHKTESGRNLDVSSLTGGAHQLSGVLEGKVKQEPERFAKLVLQFPDNSHPYYFDAVLRGLKDAVRDIDIETVLNVARRCHQLPGHPSGQWICWLVENVVERPLPDELLAMVAWYATQSSNPVKEMWAEKAQGGTAYFGGDLDSAGLNSARGSAALAMANLIYADKERGPFFLPYLEQMVQDVSLAVRACIAETLTALLNYDREMAISLFLRLCNANDVLFSSHHIERFLYYGSYTHYTLMRPILERQLASEDSKVVNSGARLVSLHALLSEEGLALAHACLNGTQSQRHATAQVFAANIVTASARTLCESGLIQLFHDDDNEVAEEASSCFRHFKGDQIEEYTDLVEAFVASPAFTKKPFFLLHALKETTAKLPDVTCYVCEAFLDRVGSGISDLRTGIAADANTIGDLAVRVYAQSTDLDIQKRCLNIVDGMLKSSAYGMQQALSSFDR